LSSNLNLFFAFDHFGKRKNKLKKEMKVDVLERDHRADHLDLLEWIIEQIILPNYAMASFGQVLLRKFTYPPGKLRW